MSPCDPPTAPAISRSRRGPANTSCRRDRRSDRSAKRAASPARSLSRSITRRRRTPSSRSRRRGRTGIPNPSRWRSGGSRSSISPLSAAACRCSRRPFTSRTSTIGGSEGCAMRFKQIVRFNWPYYATAGAVVAAALLAAPRVAPAWLRYAIEGTAAVVAMWLVASLVVSYIVYDRSRLMDWDWVLQALGFTPSAWINLHAGHDESSPALRTIFPNAQGRVFDIYDADEMTEPSIAVARRHARRESERGTPGPAAESADYRHLPLPKGTVDAALLLLSAHE